MLSTRESFQEITKPRCWWWFWIWNQSVQTQLNPLLIFVRSVHLHRLLSMWAKIFHGEVYDFVHKAPFCPENVGLGHSLLNLPDSTLLSFFSRYHLNNFVRLSSFKWTLSCRYFVISICDTPVSSISSFSKALLFSIKSLISRPMISSLPLNVT